MCMHDAWKIIIDCSDVQCAFPLQNKRSCVITHEPSANQTHFLIFVLRSSDELYSITKSCETGLGKTIKFITLFTQLSVFCRKIVLNLLWPTCSPLAVNQYVEDIWTYITLYVAFSSSNLSVAIPPATSHRYALLSYKFASIGSSTALPNQLTLRNVLYHNPLLKQISNRFYFICRSHPLQQPAKKLKTQILF